MKVTKKVRKRVTEEEIVEVKCNKCEGIIYQEGYPDWLPCAQIEYVGCYGSKRFDFKKIKFELCEDCLVKIINRLKIIPEIKDIYL